MKILVRLPNWLGDMVMSVGFLHQLPHFFPGAELSVVAKKGIHDLLDLFPPLQHRFIFSKEDFGGITGPFRFGRTIKRTVRPDLFFSLPDSLSAALMGWGTGARKRVGYKNEGRQLLLTHAFDKPGHLHRADAYVRLLELYTGQPATALEVRLRNDSTRQDYVVVNINSEAASRRLTTEKAAELLQALRTSLSQDIVLVGAPKEKEFVDGVLARIGNAAHIENLAGQTSLPELARLLSAASLMLTTDSGPAHLSNALGTQTLVLFGAGNEHRTAPYREDFRTVIRLGELSCEPCEKNICVRYGTPQCLERLSTARIVETAKKLLS